jgi:hypothetical protein
MDSTGLGVTTRRFSTYILPAIAGLGLFLAGWQLGRAMSPYYASSPIVFEEDTDDACVSAGGTTEELAALQAAGQATLTPSPAEPTPAVAAAQDPSATATTRLFVGSVNSDKYHHHTCPSAKQIKPENQRWFATKEAAEQAGYTASECTKEKLGI